MRLPKAVRNVFATCDDSKWLGEVLRGFGGQNIPLNYGQKMAVKELRQIFKGEIRKGIIIR